MNEPNVNPIQQPSETVSSLHLHKDKPQKTAQDWVRDMRMSAAVNKATTGVETDQVTPELLLATSKKLLGISKREQEPDPKDSLAFQRFYGPEMMFSEHILRDNGKLGRNILWKATNRGNLDFMPVNALEKHISSVFYDSKLAQMMDGSSPLETIDSAYKTTRLGEGGIGSIDSAPDEMRTVQPSYFGYIDPVRCFAKGTEVKTKEGWKPIEQITEKDDVLTWVKEKAVYVHPTAVLTFDYSGEMIGYNDGTVAFLVTPHHRMWIHSDSPEGWKFDFAENVVGCTVMINISDNDTPEPYVLTEDDWYKIDNKPYGKVHCLTVSGGLIYCRYLQQQGFICGQSPESLRVGLDVYMTKNVMKGTDGKLYQKFIDAKTGKEVLLDSETAANSVIAAPEMRNAKTKSVFAMGGPTGIRIVPRDSVQYYLPRADEAYSTSSNLVTMLSGVKNMRLQMGCLHPDTFVIAKDKHGLLFTTKAQTLSEGAIPGATKEGVSQVFDIRTTVAKFPPQKNWFRKVILKSGRSLITSADHRWPVLRKGEYQLVPASKLKKGDIALRTTFKDFPSRRTFVNHILVNKLIARHLGYIARSLDEPDNKKMRIQLPEEKYEEFLQVMDRLGYKDGFNTYYMGYSFCVGIRDEQLRKLLADMFGPTDKTRHIPTEILSAGASIVGAFLDGYTSDPTKLGQDSNDDIWVLDIPNLQMRDELAFLFARLETDTLYRDKVSGKAMDLALKLVPVKTGYGDMITDEIKLVQSGINSPIMVDIDVNDNLYATANGVVTHNSKYPLQAVSISSREAPLVRGLDEATGKDMPTLVGKYLGARFAPHDGVVTAVRKDRIDVLYDDGTKGSVDMYVNFPMNAKGFINNTPQVKAGQHFKKGDVLASSNYTDDKGVAAMGTNLRTGWLSWKGGTYEDAIVISESAAKKLTSTTMYKTAVDLDKTVSLGKQNYITWKPGEFTKEQMENLDASGVVKPGTVLHKEDPMILAVRTSEPSPGTMGKRVLTDLSERWEHDNPGVVTDVVKTRNGVKVYATVTAPVEIGDKLSNSFGGKGVVSQIVPDDEMPHNAKGEPLELLFSPLGLITRCYDDQTEFLTAKGWKLGKDITPEDKFYSYDPNTDTWHWSEQQDKFYSNHYIGVMYDYHGRLADFSVTHGHKFWASVDGNYQRVQIQDVFGKSIKVPSVASRYSQPDATDFHLPFVDGCRAEIPDVYDAADWAEFLGWYLSEGHAEYNEATAKYCVTITQFDNINPAKVQLIGQMLDRLGLPWKYSTACKRFCIYNKRLAAYLHQFGLAHQKYLPDWLFSQPDYVIDRFLDGFIMGDGYVGPGYEHVDGTTLYRCTIKITSEKLIDQLQMLCCMVGLPSMKTYVGPDERFPNSKPQWSLGISFGDGERALKSGWEKRDYDGKVYCPTVDTGYILTRRNGKTLVAGNTNPSQLYEALLGKVAKKTGKPITVPQFFDGSIADFVSEQMKQHNVKPDEDLINPETDLPIKDVLTGYSYIYKLKHLAESKMSARGTSSYDSEQLPAGKGMDGCFPGSQRVQTRDGFKAISTLAKAVGLASVTTMADNKERRFSRVIDRFFRVVSATELLSITPAWSYSPEGKIIAPITMYPTKNHAIYMYDMTQQHAEQLKPGCKIAGMGKRPSDHQMQVIWNLMHQSAVVDNDKLWVPYEPEAESLAAFKVGILKSLGAKQDKKGCAITLPNYRLYQAAMEDSDNGELAVALAALDDAYKDYPISDTEKRIIADWIPAKVIPDYAAEAKAIAEKQQRMLPPQDLDILPHMGLMPLIVSRIEPYPKSRGPVKVYDLTIEGIHRYVLKGGFLVSNSKRFGTLEQSALVGHQVGNIIQDAKWIRGQSNSDFWRSLRTGDIPTMPGEPLVHKKFFAHLTGSGVNVRKTPQGVSIFALTEKDVDELAGPRELKSRDTYEARNFRPIDGGLFGQDVFGINGDKWGYIQLDEPVPNPVMEEPLARLLNIPDKKFADVASGKEEVNGIRGGAAMKAALEKLDLSAEAVRAHQAFKTASASNKDKALKRYIAIERMRRSGVNPAEYMLERIPVLPPVYRPISSHNGLTMVADSNYLYAQLLDARDDMREAKGLPKELQQTASENLYNKWKELTGLYAPSDVKLQSKHVQGLLKWALGDSPKFSGLQRKVLSATVDTVGRGVVTPDSRLKLNEVGLPEEMAFNIMEPMVERSLVKRGYTPLQAMKMVKEHNAQARDVLDEVMKNHPVLMNRAPTLHKLSIMAFNPKIVAGHAIRVNPSIVVPFGLDHDGDSVSGEWSVVLDLKKLEENREILEKSGKKFLTFVGRVLHYIQGTDSDAETHTNEKEQDMFSKTAKARYTTAICSPAELPVIPGSEKQLSDNVTEWDVIPGVYTDTIDLDGSRVLAPVTKISRHTNLRMFDVTTSVATKYQSVVTASEDHSLIAINPETLDLEKIRPEDAVGRLIPRLRRDQAVTHETCQRYIQFDKPYEANYDLGFFLGCMIGDGWVTSGGQAMIACCDKSLQDAILALTDVKTTKLPVLSKTFVSSYEPDPDRFSDNAKERIDLHLDGPFKVVLKELIGTGAYNKRIPAPCFRASKAHRLGILMGLLATDGCVNYAEGTKAKKSKSKSIVYHTTSTELRDGVKYLCNSLGIRVSVTPYMGKHSKETCYAVCLSIVDVAREVAHNPKLFRIPCEKKQKALEKICMDVQAHENTCPAVTDIVPFPAALSEELTWANSANAASVSEWRKRGYISMDRAIKLAADLRKLDWSKFEPPKNYARKLRRGHTPEQAAELVNAWCDIVDASDYLAWVHVDKVVPSTCTEGWDCTVPGPYTFALYDGTIVQDTVNIHAPVSDKARQEAYNRMFPERNLIGMRSRTILYKPEKEYQQGLYIGTRMKKGDNVRTHYFNTLEEAKEAYRQGLIDIDDPIEIKHN